MFEKLKIKFIPKNQQLVHIYAAYMYQPAWRKLASQSGVHLRVHVID